MDASAAGTEKGDGQAQDPAKKKAKRERKPKAKRTEIAREVAQELHKLRPVMREIGGSLLDRLDGQLAGLALYLEGQSLPLERTPLPPGRTLAAMLAAVKALKIKPKKGRAKDLARIEALLESLTAKMPPGA